MDEDMKRILLFLAFLIGDVSLAQDVKHPLVMDVVAPAVVQWDYQQAGLVRLSRLCGIKTPEPNTEAGRAATLFLRREVYKRGYGPQKVGKLICFPVGWGTPCDAKFPDRGSDPSEQHLEADGTELSTCMIGDDDLAQVMIDAGHAEADHDMVGDYYGLRL